MKINNVSEVLDLAKSHSFLFKTGSVEKYVVNSLTKCLTITREDLLKTQQENEILKGKLEKSLHGLNTLAAMFLNGKSVVTEAEDGVYVCCVEYEGEVVEVEGTESDKPIKALLKCLDLYYEWDKNPENNVEDTND